MTTIATRGDGVVVADSQCTYNDTKTRVTKLHRLPCGGVVGGAGVFTQVMRYIRWMQAGSKGEAPKLKGSELLVAYADGRTGSIFGGVFIEADGPHAIGSGTQGALTMMAAGATALEAVEAVALVDPSTSGPFLAMAVEPTEVNKKRHAPKRRPAKAR